MTAESQTKSRPYDPDLISESDPTSRFAEWQTLAKKSLRGRSLDELVHKTLDGIAVQPVYAGATEAQQETDRFPFTRKSKQHLSAEEPSPAQIKQRYCHPVPGHCNQQVLEELARGVTSIHLDYFSSQNQAIDDIPATHRGIIIDSIDALSETLNGVLLELAPVSISAGNDFYNAADQLRTLWSDRGVSDAQCVGAFNADPLGMLARTGDENAISEHRLRQFRELTSETIAHYQSVTSALVDVCPYHDAGASTAQELGLMLATYRYYIELLLEHGLEINQFISTIDIRLSVDSDYFNSIAKIRAARTLIAHLLSACGVEQKNCSVSIWAATSARMNSRREPWVNILRNTVAAAAANVGGATSLSVAAFDSRIGETDAPGRRIARNTAIILQEESSLHRICDPLGGSGYIEALTTSLCEKSWEYFQEIERSGGIAAALLSGTIQTSINQSEQTYDQKVRTRSHTLVGINDYPSTDDALPRLNQDADASARQALVGQTATSSHKLALTPKYVSATFEQIRESVDSNAQTTGRRPSIQTVAYGNPPSFIPRVQFCHNLLTTAGIVSNEPVTAQDAQSMLESYKQSQNNDSQRSVLLCPALGTDDATIAKLIRQLADAGAQEIFVANSPIEPIEDLGSVSIHFIYKGCDVRQSLELLVSATGALPQ